MPRYERIIQIIIGGWFIALLFMMTLRTSSLVVFEDDEFKLKNEYYISLYSAPQYEFKVDERLRTELESHPEWEIQQILYGDFTNEGKQQAAVYVWKEGTYYKAMPFWVTENDDSYKQHLFIYEFTPRGIKAVWQSSNLPYINTQTQLADVDNDGKNELVVIERPYLLGRIYFGTHVAIWQWDSWGFKNIWRSEKGRYENLRT